MDEKELLHNAPIGVFDSGVGGLTVAQVLYGSKVYLIRLRKQRR